MNIVTIESIKSIDFKNLNSNKDDYDILTNDEIKQFLKIANDLSDIPQLLSPQNESTDTSNIVKFNWTDVGQPSDDVFYEFVMDNDTDFCSPEAARFAINNWSNSTMNEEPYTTFLTHFNDTLKSEEQEDPLVATGLSYSEGKFGKGIFINASSSAELCYNTTENINKKCGTIEFWIKLEKDLVDIDDYLVMFDYILKDDPLNRIVILIHNETHQVFAISTVNYKNYYLIPTRETIWKADEWHHICMTWGGEMARLYLDGIEEAASTYFPIGEGNKESFYLGSVLGIGNWINATFDELRISSIQRFPLWKSEIANVNVSYLIPMYRFPIWNLNESEYTHIFDKDGTYYWKVRAHNASGPGGWSDIGVITINRILDKKYTTNIKILDSNSIPIPYANLSYEQESISKLMGVDANYVVELLDQGYEWYHEGSKIDMYEFLGIKKSNSFRTRLWTNVGGKNSLENATKMAKWAQNNGSMPYLTIFLSDNWADVNKAPLPKIFEGLTFEQRLTEIKEYSKNVTKHFRDNGVNIEFYEIGNEIDFGICGIYATDKMPRHNLTWLRYNIWHNESRIINASINGIRQIDPDAKTMLHIAISDPAFASAFYTAMMDFGVPYDIIGLSYHPVAGGDGYENAFKETIKILSTSGLPGSDKIIIPETSYSSQINGSIYFKNWNKSITEFPLTPEGQKKWVNYQLEWIYQHPNIVGMNYWSPDFYSPIWEGFSWFNSTGDSKVVVNAYPEFFNLKKISTSGWDLSNTNGIVTIKACRGILELKVQFGNHIEYFNVIISPFRKNSFIINLPINLGGNNNDGGGGDGRGGDSGGDHDNKTSRPIIHGYNLFLLLGLISLITVILIKRQFN